MYEDTLGTDWDTLDKEDVLRRAFALGVAAALGEPNETEYERIRTEAGSTYNTSLIDLAYREGKRKANGLESERSDTEDVWDELVDEGVDSTTASAGRSDRRDTRTAIPDALRRIDIDEHPHDGREKLRLPDFVTRR